MREPSADARTLRSFAVTMMAALAVVVFFAGIKQKYGAAGPCFIAASFFLVGFFYPSLLKPAHRLWMGLASVLGWVNSRVLLSLIYYFVFFPLGLVLRILRPDPLERRIERDKTSYWKEKEGGMFDPSRCERQF